MGARSYRIVSQIWRYCRRTRSSRVSPSALILASTTRASRPRPWSTSQRGLSGIQGSSTMDAAPQAICSRLGRRHDQVLVSLKEAYVMPAPVMAPT